MKNDWQKTFGIVALLLVAAASQADATDRNTGGPPSVAGAACQAGTTADEEADDAKEKRKQYIKDVLSKSSGTKLQGRQLARTGSGFFVAEDGSILTSHYIVDGCPVVSISPTFARMAIATPIGTDEKSDLALLRADLTPPGTANLIHSEGAFSREPGYILGYPTLGMVTTEPTLTPVEVLGSQKTAHSASTMAIQGDIRLGNSGGVLLDSGGGVIGAVLANVNATQTYSATGGASKTVGLVLPSEGLQAFLDAHGVEHRLGMQLPPKPADRILIDARPFMVQVGCWQ